MRDILKSSKNSKKEYLQQEDESNKKNYWPKPEAENFNISAIQKID